MCKKEAAANSKIYYLLTSSISMMIKFGFDCEIAHFISVHSRSTLNQTDRGASMLLFAAILAL